MQHTPFFFRFPIVLLVCLNLNAAAQDVHKYFSIGVIPTAYFDPITPSIGLSVEHSLTKSINVELTYGFDPNIRFLNWHTDPKSRHHEYKLMLKYILKEESRMNQYKYVGIDFLGNYNRYNKERNTFKEGNVFYDYEKAEVIRTVNGMRLNLGMAIDLFRDKIWTDIFMGAGAREVNIRYFPENATERDDPLIDEWFTPFDRNAGKKFRISLVFGFKIAFRIY